MKNHCSISGKSVLYGVIALIMCFFCAMIFTACNDNGESEKTVREQERNLYLGALTYDAENGIIYACVGMNGDEQDGDKPIPLTAKLKWVSYSYAQDTWYNREDVEMSVSSAELYDEVNSVLTDEQRLHDSVIYERLKVVLRYDTIYKSIKSDASVTKQGRYYVHKFATDEAQEQETFYLRLTTQNSASWYTLLIGCVIIFAVALTGVMLAVKGNLWQKKKNKNG